MTKRARYHYLECPKCESCFRVVKDVTSVPTHKCWAEDKERAQPSTPASSPGPV